MKLFKVVLIAVFVMVLATPATIAGPQEISQKTSVEKKKVEKQTPFLEIQSAVRETLESMVDAYTSKNVRRFMTCVSEDFAGDNTLLDRRLRRNFSRFADMEMRYTLNNVTPDSANRNISVSVTFTRSHTDIKTTKRINKTGTSSFTFRMAEGKAKLTAMRGPMFGVGG